MTIRNIGRGLLNSLTVMVLLGTIVLGAAMLGSQAKDACVAKAELKALAHLVLDQDAMEAEVSGVPVMQRMRFYIAQPLAAVGWGVGKDARVEAVRVLRDESYERNEVLCEIVEEVVRW